MEEEVQEKVDDDFPDPEHEDTEVEQLEQT